METDLNTNSRSLHGYLIYSILNYLAIQTNYSAMDLGLLLVLLLQYLLYEISEDCLPYHLVHVALLIRRIGFLHNLLVHLQKPTQGLTVSFSWARCLAWLLPGLALALKGQ